MDDIELTNFKFRDSKIDLDKIIEKYWINNQKIIRDFGLNEVKSTFEGFDFEYDKKIEESREKLQSRAKKYFPVDDVFLLYDQKDIRWEGFKDNNSELPQINISKGINYKTITSIRSNEELFNQLDQEKTPKAFVLANVLITSDNKLVMGKRKFYWDRPFDTYECPGAFLHEEDLEINSIIKSAKNKIIDDYQIADFEIKTIPFVIYYLSRILEVVCVCISKISLSSKELKSDFYEEILSIDNTEAGLEKLTKMPLDLFHTPSRTIIQFYYENFLDAKRLLEELK